ncbi:hypothetical protein GCM10027159_01440 [Lysobacter terrae]
MRRFHYATQHEVDESTLQVWWQTFDDEVLNHFIEACLKQNAELSLASLRVTEACVALTGTLEDVATQPDCLKAWVLFHSLRVRLVAATARTYVDVLALQERLLCVELAIRHQCALLQYGHAPPMDRAFDASHSAQAADLPELHLHRVRVQGERDAALAGLAWLVGEPLDLVLTRVDGRMLSPAISAIPASGTPDALELRRPDLLAAALQAPSQGNEDAHQTRVDAIRREQAFDRAVCEVERALAVLTSAIGESPPARAAALSAGNRASALVQKMRAGQPDFEAMLHANRLYHGHCDREIEVRARGYRALVDLYEALGAGWPAPIEAAKA